MPFTRSASAASFASAWRRPTRRRSGSSRIPRSRRAATRCSKSRTPAAAWIRRRSGGAIDVTSTVGRGSCFAVYLPLVDAPAVVDDNARAPLARGQGERVMVVDDEEALLAVTCESLKRLGYEPTGFADAKAALAEFERAPEHYDAVLTDEVMPEFSGTQLATVLRGRRANLPIILVSGYIGSMISDLAASAGVGEILKKPVHAQELASALERALGRA